MKLLTILVVIVKNWHYASQVLHLDRHIFTLKNTMNCLTYQHISQLLCNYWEYHTSFQITSRALKLNTETQQMLSTPRFFHSLSRWLDRLNKLSFLSPRHLHSSNPPRVPRLPVMQPTNYHKIQTQLPFVWGHRAREEKTHSLWPTWC